MTARCTLLPAFSKRWWALWRAKANAGETTAAMVHAARRGKGWQAKPDEVPSDFDLVPVRVGSPEFKAWRLHFQMLGATFPTPTIAPVVWLPAGDPPSSRRAA